ncbi:2-hydroxyacid dehydrogenase [Sphingomonas sp.]|uniref:2-hydroxyacid dehydrogenase n=1 Tax=Sphingomonas sp. TaxID=28214 RepID=UPI00286A9D93|nr:2-hydroxyacid dehydrogenase [Sphingomonas sp.]
MKVAVYSTKPYDRQFLEAANGGRHELRYLDCRLTISTTALAKGASAVCLFANDEANATTIMAFAHMGIRLIALRAAGFNNVDVVAAKSHGIVVARVPTYSPHAVAEHTFALILSLVRKVHRAYNRVREGNFSLDGLMGFDLVDKTIGIVGAGNIGSVVARIATGFGCKVLAHDPVRRSECERLGVEYVGPHELLEQSDIVTLHCPLNRSTRHLIDSAALARMKAGAILINTSRGAVVDTHSVVDALKRQSLAGLAIDVYEEEDALFFEDRSDQAIMDDQFARLLTFPNVLITGHQGFFTVEALTNIAATTIANLDSFEQTGRPLHPVMTDIPAVQHAAQLVPAK